MSGISTTCHSVMVQKARAKGFECDLYGSELEAGLQLLWQHLVHAPDGAKALAALRAQMDIDWALFESEQGEAAAAQG